MISIKKGILLSIVVLLVHTHIYAVPNISDTQSKLLTIAFREQPYSLNFLEEFNHSELHIHSALYNGLLTSHPVTLQPEVGLAISWIINESKDVYVFNLRNNAKFSDGTNITTHDVKSSWIAAIQANNAFISLFELISGVTEFINGEGTIEDIGIHIINEVSIKITLKNPAPYFLTTITHPAFSISSQEQMKVKDWDSNPTQIVCSGPFFVSEVHDNELRLEKNNFFWASDNIYFDHVHITFYPQDKTEQIVQDVNDGKIHWSTFYQEGPQELEQKEWLSVHKIFGSEYLFFGDTVSEPWNNHEIRTAIKLLIPFDTLLKEKYMFPASGFIPTIEGLYDNDLTSSSQDKEKALQLLEKNGFPKGKGLAPLIFLAPQYADGTYDTIFDTLVDILRSELESTIELHTFPTWEYYQRLKDTPFTIGVTSWIGDFADPAAFLQLWETPNPALGHNFNDAEYKRLLTQSHQGNGADRVALLIEAEKYLLEHSVVLPLYYLYAVNIVRFDILKGWSSNMLDVHSIGHLYFKEEKPISNITLLSPTE